METDLQNEKTPAKKRVLVTPLDWGLGHATRCIPIINILKKNGVEVWFAGEGPTLEILVKTFPGTPFLPLKGYRVSYGRSGAFLIPKLLVQAGKIKKQITAENNWLAGIMEEYQIDGIISDNRFGLWSNSHPAIFVTHQLHIKTGFRIFDFVAQKINFRYIKKFSACWVVDRADGNNLAGELSHPKSKNIPFSYRYLGILSRFTYRSGEQKGYVLFLISGPEPARTSFENKILTELKHLKQTVVLVRGLPQQTQTLNNLPENIRVYNHAGMEELSQLISEAGLVVCRAGYSTLMDLCTLKKHAVIIPTPGQTEQEYLGRYHHWKKHFMMMEEKDFTWNRLSEALKSFQFSDHWPETGIDEALVEEFIASL